MAARALTFPHWCCFLNFVLIFLTFSVFLFDISLSIVSKEELLGDCQDGSGNKLVDGQNYTDGCSTKICHEKQSGNYFVTLSCHVILENEFLDAASGLCKYESDPLASYPHCCPNMVCATAAPLTTISPTACYDRATAYACGVWSNLTSACTDFSSYNLKNFTDVFCQKTCGICTISG